MADNTRLAREVGAKIKYLRQKRGLSQEALALSCDMNPAFLGHVERGMRSPTLNTLQRICDGLGITLTELTKRGIEVGSLTTIWSTLRRLGLRHKKVAEGYRAGPAG